MNNVLKIHPKLVERLVPWPTSSSPTGCTDSNRTSLIRAGVDISAYAEWMGHSITMAMKHYRHVAHAADAGINPR